MCRPVRGRAQAALTSEVECDDQSTMVLDIRGPHAQTSQVSFVLEEFPALAVWSDSVFPPDYEEF